MLRDLWMRITGRHREESAERAQEYEHMSPEERTFVSESVDDRAARIETDAHLRRLRGRDDGRGSRPLRVLVA